MSDFKVWSALNPNAKKELKPDLGLRCWNTLSLDEKELIWKHLEWYFFKKEHTNTFRYTNYSDSVEVDYQFFGKHDPEKIDKVNRILFSIWYFNILYKRNNYTPNFLSDKSYSSACTDFRNIFFQQSQNTVLEVLSFYSRAIIREREDESIRKEDKETDSQFQSRLEEWRLEEFDKFSEVLNEVFSDFGIDVQLTRLGFVAVQEERINEEVYKPVLKILSHKKWESVSHELREAFNAYRKNTPEGYSGCVTHVVSAVEAFLQTLLECPGKGTLDDLMKKAKIQGKIPNDPFSSVIFSAIRSHLARERKEKADSHPTKQDPTQKDARMVLNLAMVFFERCLST